jgi:hypothetical protein
LTRCPDDGEELIHLGEKDLTGQVIDNRYTIREQLGRGGMGTVYRAEQKLIQRTVALKVLSREVVEDDTFVKRFLNEARIIASLENPHTVTLYDCAGVRHSCAVSTSGDLWCWGNDSAGQCGGVGPAFGKPAKIPGTSQAAFLECGNDFTCAVGENGEVDCWGKRGPGLGKGNWWSHLPVPIKWGQ